MKLQTKKGHTVNTDIQSMSVPLYCASTLQAIGVATTPTVNTDVINCNAENDVRIDVAMVAGSVNFSEDDFRLDVKQMGKA